MGFYVTESYQMEADPLPKNRVGGFRDPSIIHARRFPAQVVEPHQEAVTFDSSTVSGVGEWLSNDPIGISGGLNQYVFCANNPVNFRDPDGKIWIQIGGTVIGGAVNYINNFNAYVHGSISGADYAKSVVFGAGAGLLSTVIPGAGGVVAGGALAGINDAYNQSINTQNGEIDWAKSGKTAALGVGAGAVGYLGESLGKGFVFMPDQIGKVAGSKASSFWDYSDIGGLSGMLGGTLMSEGLDSKCGNKK